MALSSTIRRALLCVLLTVSLCVPAILAGAPIGAHQDSIQIAALSGPTATILLKHRTSFDTAFVPAPFRDAAVGDGQALECAVISAPLAHGAARIQSGRSPPSAIS